VNGPKATNIEINLDEPNLLCVECPHCQAPTLLYQDAPDCKHCGIHIHLHNAGAVWALVALGHSEEAREVCGLNNPWNWPNVGFKEKG